MSEASDGWRDDNKQKEMKGCTDAEQAEDYETGYKLECSLVPDHIAE